MSHRYASTVARVTDVLGSELHGTDWARCIAKREGVQVARNRFPCSTLAETRRADLSFGMWRCRGLCEARCKPVVLENT
jgi:hypothetical protein